MNNKFYSFREKLLLFFLLLVSAGSLFCFFQFKTLAFPEYNITFTTDRAESTQKAKEFLSEMGIHATGYKDVTVFTVDEEAKTYLEREVNITSTARAAENNIDLWHFTTRVFQPLQKEEYSVSFLPNGRLSGFTRTVAEDRPGAVLSSNEAQLLAEQFLEQRTETHLTEWRLVDINTTSREKRIDHSFIWEQKNFSISDATYRKEVHLLGDQIGGYAEYLKVPESWQRQYENERSQNDLAQTVAEVISFLLFGISAVMFFILQYRKNNLRIRLGVYVAIVTFIIVVLATLNSLSSLLFTYETTESWGAFLGQIILSAIVSGGMLGFVNLFIIVVGESLYRQFRPKFVAVEHLYGRGLFTKQVNKSLFIGSFAGIISFGYVVLFYIVGRNFNFWSPAEINYNDAFSTYIPWIYPLFIGFTAAIFEEGLFRLFAIPFLIKYVKKPWIAVVITAFVWGFLHSNYPQSPWFARGFEVGLEGLLLGFLFLRYGILASIVSHYTFNALITSVALATSASLINIVISFFFALLPLVVGVIFLTRAIWKKGFRTQVDSLTNHYVDTLTKNIVPQTKMVKEQITTAYKAVVSKRFVWVTSLLAILSVVVIFITAPHIDVATQVNTITRSEALILAKKALQTDNIHVDEYKNVVQYTPSPPNELEQEYILEHADFEAVQNIYSQNIPTALWSIRFFKPVAKEEYIVYLLPSGELYSLDHLLPEDARGATLSEEGALKIAKEYLQHHHKDISSYELIASEVEKRKNRTDYYFSFENTTEQIKDARLRADIQVLGDEPSGFGEYIKLPESWMRDKQKTTEFDFLFDIITLLPVIFISIYGVTTFFWLVKGKQLRFKQSLLLASPFVLISLLQVCNQLPHFYSFYQTSIPLETYVIEQVLGIVVEQIMSFLFVAVVIALFLGLWRKYFVRLLPADRKERLQYLRDALFIGYVFPFLLAGYGIVIAYFSLKYNLLPAFAFPEELIGIDTLLPAMAVIDSLATSIVALLLGISILLVLYKKIHSPIKIAGIILAFLLIVELRTLVSSTVDSTTLLLQVSITVLSFLLGAFVILRVIKANILAYMFLLYSSIIFTNAWDLWNQEHMFFIFNGYILFFLAALPMLMYVWLWRMRK